MADNGYDPRAQAMEEFHFDWRCIVCCIWNNSISLGLNRCILIWITPPGLNVTNTIPPFIYSVGPGNVFKLSYPNVFFVLFFVVDSFRSPCCLSCSYSPPSPCHLCFRYPPTIPHVACVLFYPNHLILRWVVNECVRIRIKRRRKCHPSDPLMKGRKIEGVALLANKPM